MYVHIYTNPDNLCFGRCTLKMLLFVNCLNLKNSLFDAKIYGVIYICIIVIIIIVLNIDRFEIISHKFCG